MFSRESPHKRKSDDDINFNEKDMELPSCSSKRLRKDSTEDIETKSIDPTTQAASSSSISNSNKNLERVREIIAREFQREMKAKESQIDLIDERLEEAHNLLQRLRYAIVAEYYKKQELAQAMSEASKAMNDTPNNSVEERKHIPVPLHPSIKKIMGKRPQNLEEIMRACPKRAAAKNAQNVLVKKSAAERREEKRIQKVIREKGIVIDHSKQNIKQEPTNTNETLDIKSKISNDQTISRLHEPDPHALNSTRLSNKTKCHFVVGNTSKFIGTNDADTERSQANGNTVLSHKWLVYVQMKDTEVPIENFIKKVRFFLHPSYRPNDVIDIHARPFQVARRGWGEFPMRIQIFFHDKFHQKPVQLIHKVILDKTKSGRHTLGAETVVEVWLRNESSSDIVTHSPKKEILSPYNDKMNVTIPAIAKPRTISFTSVKDAIDDNFFEFLNKIEESRTSICADIEKIEPTVLIPEHLEPKMSIIRYSPITKEYLRSPVKRTPPGFSPRRGGVVDNAPSFDASQQQLPKAIKEAANKLRDSINQSETLSPKSIANVPPTSSQNSVTSDTIVPSTSSSAIETLSSSPVVPSSSNSLPASSGPQNTNPLSNIKVNVPSLSGRIFNNVSGTVILPVTKLQQPMRQQNLNGSPQITKNATSNDNLPKPILQKKLIQVVNAQGQIKTIPMLVATSKSLSTLPTTLSSSTANATSPISIINSKNFKIQGPITKIVSTSSLITKTVDSSVASKTSSTTSTISKQLVNTITSNTTVTSTKINPTSSLKNMVFQKEGKLYIIDPLQMKLKQQQKNQVSLLKPQLKQQCKQQQQQQQNKQQIVLTDHDYSTAVASTKPQANSIFTINKILPPVNTQVHFGMRETRLNALKTKDLQRLRCLYFERKLNNLTFTNMRSAVEFLLRRLPLVVLDKDSPITVYPFVCGTYQEFQALPAFKQRSCEWLRAKFIEGLMRKMKSLQDLNNSTEETFWSTREIATFARHYAYTPPIKSLYQPAITQDEQDPKSSSSILQGSREKFSALIKSEMKKNEQLNLEYSTLSPATIISRWLENMQEQLHLHQDELNDNEIIIVDDLDENPKDHESDEEKLSSEERVRKRIYGSPLKIQNDNGNLSYLPPPARLETAFELAGNICKDLSIRLSPEEIVPGIIHPSAQTLLARVLKLFLEKLLRLSVASQKEQMQQDRVSNNLPQDTGQGFITSQVLRRVISQCADFDFLTNRFLGVVPSIDIKQEDKEVTK